MARLHAWLDRALAASGEEVAAAWPVYVAIDEAITNVARHGYGPERTGEVDVVVSIDAPRITITLVDDAPPFDPRRPPRREPPADAAAPERERPGGHGLALVLGLMDDVAYEYRDGRNVLTLVSSLQSSPPRTP